MKVTISVLKADIGSIGGHICPSERLMDTVNNHVTEHKGNLVVDAYVSYTGDDIAIVLTHSHGAPNVRIDVAFRD